MFQAMRSLLEVKKDEFQKPLYTRKGVVREPWGQLAYGSACAEGGRVRKWRHKPPPPGYLNKKGPHGRVQAPTRGTFCNKRGVPAAKAKRAGIRRGVCHKAGERHTEGGGGEGTPRVDGTSRFPCTLKCPSSCFKGARGGRGTSENGGRFQMGFKLQGAWVSTGGTCEFEGGTCKSEESTCKCRRTLGVRGERPLKRGAHMRGAHSM